MDRRAFARRLAALPVLASGGCAAPAAVPPRAADGDGIVRLVEATIAPLMREHDIPGMSVAVVADGASFHIARGVASRRDARPVTPDTLFEVGSVSKTFTAALACRAQRIGAVSLSRPASDWVDALRGTAFDRIRLIDLGTYAAGGLPLQFPDDVVDEPTMLAWFRRWRPEHEPGTHRRYSNPSIGLMGHAVARALGRPFAAAMERDLLPALGLRDTWLTVPEARLHDYAWGHAKDDRAIRVSPGVLDAEAYGVKTSAADLARYLRVQLEAAGGREPVHRAVADTHAGVYRVGAMTQALGWESWAWPTDPDRLVEGSSSRMALETRATTRDAGGDPPGPRLLCKTGSTNGFGACVAFVPDRGLGIGMLANRNYPNAARVTAARSLLAALGA